MESSNPVYELLIRCESMGMHLKGYDLMLEPDIVGACQDFLRSKHGFI